MLLRPYLILYRNRLVAAALFSLLAALVEAVLGANLCNCPPDLAEVPNRFFYLVYLSNVILCIFLGLILGFGPAGPLPGGSSLVRFLLTRPIARTSIQLYPLLIAIASIVLLPGLGWLVLLACLRLLHSPWLAHLLAIAERAPSASELGPNPGLVPLLGALHLGPRYVAAVSVGLGMYAPLAAQRWLMLNGQKAVRIFGGITVPILVLPMAIPLLLSIPSCATGIFLLPPPHAGLTYLPSNLGVALHLAFAAAWSFGTFAALREIEV
jgi:hypothetical protein